MHLTTRLLITAISLILSLPLSAQQEAISSNSSPSVRLPVPSSTNTPPTATPEAQPSPSPVAPSSLATNESKESSAPPELSSSNASSSELLISNTPTVLSNTLSQLPLPASTLPPVRSSLGTSLSSTNRHLLSTNALARLRSSAAKFRAATTGPRTLTTNNPTELSTPKDLASSTNLPSSDVDDTSLSAPSAQIGTNVIASAKNPNEKVSIQFPHTSVLEVLSLYEKLTGKRIIRDSNLTGPELSIMIADPVSRQDAINILESSMLLNGYVVVPVDEKTIKVLGPGRPPRTEGLPLYLEESELPTDGDKLASFYQPLHFLNPTEAINIVQGVVQLNPFGSLVAVPNTSAIVITDKTPIIRKALALLKVIDHESSQIITEFIPLQRANAEKTVETLNQIFGKESAPSSSSTPPKNAQSPPNNQQQPTVEASSPGDERVFSGKVQFIPDKRTNRILVVTRAENYRYVRELISKLDQAQLAEEPLVRPLNYMSSTDVFPVLLDMLKNKDDESTDAGAKAQATPQNPFKNAAGGAGGQNPMDPSGANGSSGVNAGGNHGDRLNESAQQNPPQSAIIGSTSLVADPTANTIIVYGPPESKAKAKQIIDLLDRRPQQVYLAAVIGEMKLAEGMDYGSSYLLHYKGFNTLANSIGGPAGAAILNGINSALGINGTNAAVASAFVNNNNINNVVNANNTSGGLTMFGSIGGSVDMYAKFLESTGKFRTIARPVVYTSNNKKATILSGQRIPYQSSTLSSIVNGASPGASPNQTANSITANITYQDVLLKLEVIPLINSDKEVNLIIAQQNQTVDDTATKNAAAAGVNAPVVNTQELTTSVRVPSGSTIVLGGLIQDERDTDERGIPYINKIPIIGPLLGGHTAKNKVRRELVVMIQPIVIDSNESMMKASDTQGGTSDLGMLAKGLQKKLQPTPSPTPKKKKFQLFPMKKIDNF